MSEHFSNNAQTTLDGAIDDTVTSLDVIDDSPFPTAAPFRILVEAEGANTDEIMTVTAISGLTYTVTRASESTAGVQTASAHGDGAIIKHVLTRKSLLKMGGFINSVKDTADTPDDEFELTTLDGKWTVVSGSSGTVSIQETGNVARYDLTTRPGTLLLQTGATSQSVFLRQDYTLADGNSIVAAFNISHPVQDGGVVGDEQQLGIALNSDDTSPFAGSTRLEFYAGETDTSTWDVQIINTGHNGGNAGATSIRSATATTLFLRVIRSGLFYGGFYSFDGKAWAGFGAASWASAHTNLWIFCRANATGGTYVPIHGVEWFRLGGNGLDPWPWV